MRPPEHFPVRSRRVAVQHDAHARPGGGASSGDPNVGRVLDGRYRVGPRIARGGMASVYEGTDLRLDRTVAVKIMHAGLGDDDAFAARFVREARAAARLSHPNVVGVYDQGEDDGTVFLVMELISGHTLRDTISKESPMPATKALALMEPVLSALGSAHRAGLIHRDIKPENVLIADDGRVKVADFGLAKAVSTDTQHTATKGVLIGTVSYLAPELVVEGHADARADVYAAGVVMFELLTGTKPHEGETPIQVAYKHVHNDVPPPSSLVPELPSYVDALVARATSREPGLRPADASVLLHQVHRVSNALEDGVTDDPELTQDLLPVSLSASEADTSPDFWDEAELAEILEPAPSVREPGVRETSPPEPVEREHTTTYPMAKPPPPRPPEEPASDGERPRRSRRGPLLLVLALVLALLVGGGAYWLGWARYTSTPGVLGMTEDEAQAKLEAAGLKVEYADPVYSETVPDGRVIKTDPSPGSRVLDSGTVEVTVSLGKERYDVPRLRGRSVDQAQDALLEVKLAYDETVQRYSETVPEGEVIGSRPRAGTTLKPGAPVDLIVSKGRRPIKVGDWVGKDADEAIQTLKTRGLKPKVTDEEYSDTVDEGDVISQDPSGGTLFRNDVVNFTVSLGPELIEVPSVRGQGVEDATEQLEDLGFEVEVDSSFPDPLGFVFGTNPSAGELAPKGSTITLIVV
ncbi:MAG TPA: Stk1 family PASTA domain-containing Ser/Thr kinase [Nocardioides sp.]|nr:Stk1 family PASTA domain-containing Ser/Thr kinase [Nocardioides sp.]